MFCSHCGKEVAAGAKFCANCGAAVNSQPTPATEPPKAPAPTAQREVPAVEQVGGPGGNVTGSGGQPEKKKKGVPKKLLIIVSAVLVLIVGFGAVLSLFGDGSEPDFSSDIPSNLDDNTSDTPEGTATKTGTFSLDWIDDILLVPGGAELYYYEDSDVQAHSRPYTFEEGGIVDFIGYSNSEQINYRTAEIDGGMVCTGLAPDGAVYAEVWDDCLGPVGDYYFSVVCEYEPVIGRRDDGYCYLFYMWEYDSGGSADPCYEMYMVQPTDSPNYEDWNFKAYVHCNNLQYFDYLNGTRELEIISIPTSSGNVGSETTSTIDISLSDWVSRIPVASNRGLLMGGTNIPTSVTESPYTELDEASLFGLADIEDIHWYSLTSSIGGYRDGKKVVSVKTWDESMTITDPSWMLLYNILPVDEETNIIDPVVVKTDYGPYLFCYRYENHPDYKNSYIIFLASPADPFAPYLQWTITATVAFAEKDFCDYLNGSISVEVVHVPGMKVAPEWINHIPAVSGSVSIPELPENAQEITLNESPQSHFWGIPHDSDLMYYNTVINGADVYWAVHNGNVVYTSETILGNPVYVSNYSDLSSVQPLIITPKAEENTLPILNYYLLYKADNCYLILLAKNERAYFDPYAHYKEFRINSFVKVTDPEYCEILNGLQYLFVSQIPDSATIQRYNGNV